MNYQLPLIPPTPHRIPPPVRVSSSQQIVTYLHSVCVDRKTQSVCFYVVVDQTTTRLRFCVSTISNLSKYHAHPLHTDDWLLGYTLTLLWEELISLYEQEKKTSSRAGGTFSGRWMENTQNDVVLCNLLIIFFFFRENLLWIFCELSTLLNNGVENYTSSSDTHDI